jgi:hypothetical protein
MSILGVLLALSLLVLILFEAFETMVLPRRVTRRYRYTRLFYRTAWIFWRALASRIPAGKWREGFLARFGPLSLLALFATWLAALIIAFGLLQWSAGTGLQGPEKQVDLLSYFYLSGTTFFTLGYGDVIPVTALGRLLAVVESGMGLGFLAVIIGYLPVLYQAFSRRERTISLLDARAGSPPSAAEFLLRLARSDKMPAGDRSLEEWERWAAELLESHLSFPVLSFYRSQHDNQSWLAALTTILDTCTLLIVAVQDQDAYQAQLTFAMARHAVVDLALVFKVIPQAPTPDRLPAEQAAQLREQLGNAGLDMRAGAAIDANLAQVRGMYEPFVAGLAQYFFLALPPILPEEVTADNWQRSAWMPRPPGIGNLPVRDVARGDHFD